MTPKAGRDSKQMQSAVCWLPVLPGLQYMHGFHDEDRWHRMHMHASRNSLVMAGLGVNSSVLDVDGSVMLKKSSPCLVLVIRPPQRSSFVPSGF